MCAGYRKAFRILLLSVNLLKAAPNKHHTQTPRVVVTGQIICVP
ncbi:hypothetical protein HMPREF0742_00119 [Rothia aeria F0184]|uniref:Uncharacterized protein n=1 Tax=Rothia aeria F0184 TaxID=888019 RepID=U7V9G2_9MICC|nr:hypothetical protein HMPREF0742_00119 [Rothia aeria F0184]